MKKRFSVACIPYEIDGDAIGDYLGGIIMFDIPFEVTGDSLIALEDLTLSIALKKTAKKFIANFSIYDLDGVMHDSFFRVSQDKSRTGLFKIDKGDCFERNGDEKMGSSAGVPYRTLPLS